MMENGEQKRPVLTKVSLITEMHVEFHWDQEIALNGGVTGCYHVYYKGEELPLYERVDSDEWNVGTVYEPKKKRATVSLKTPVTKEMIPDLTASVEKTANALGVEPDGEQRYQVEWEPYYTKISHPSCGIPIKSCDAVRDETHAAAGKILDLMLQKLPDAAAKMAEYHAELAIYPIGQDAYDIPEHRVGFLYMHRPVEGYGGVVENPVNSISEVNVLRILEGEFTTRYREELILAHEFAHGIHLIGIEHLADRTLAERFRAVYAHAKEAGKWPNTYAISNYEEYFATLTTVWFNVMEEGVGGTWDGVRGPVNTREELYRYDREAYDFFHDIYPEDFFPAPWNVTKNLYDIDGSRLQESEEA